MKLIITIRMDNAAFFDDGEQPARGREVARILRNLADQVEDDADLVDHATRLADINGNAVGLSTVTD